MMFTFIFLDTHITSNFGGHLKTLYFPQVVDIVVIEIKVYN